MAETPLKPYQDPYNKWLIRTAKETVMRSRKLLDETKPLVEPQQLWPIVRDKEKKPPQGS